MGRNGKKSLGSLENITKGKALQNEVSSVERTLESLLQGRKERSALRGRCGEDKKLQVEDAEGRAGKLWQKLSVVKWKLQNL